MAARMLLGRWSPGKSATKRQLRNSCEAAGVDPRPNWAHASHEELLAAVGPALEKAGVLVTARLDKAPHYGGRALYQTVARWGVRRASNDAPPGHISWDAQDGKFHASFPGPRYAAARAAVEEAVRSAERHAAINRADIRDQLALAAMEHAPVAPYCSVPHIGPGLWMLGQDGIPFNQVRRFLQLTGHPLLELSELEGPEAGFRSLISASFEEAARRYRTRTGWLAVAKTSHDILLGGLA
jgi:hypothetical protein